MSSSVRHMPTPDTRLQVATMSGIGVPQRFIAAYFGITDVTLRKHYKQDLDKGRADAMMQIGSTLFQKAIDGDNACLIFYAKTQMGWNETFNVTGEIDLVPKFEKTITTIDNVNIIEHESESASQTDTGAVLSRD
jgi:hypothetical protein